MNRKLTASPEDDAAFALMMKTLLDSCLARLEKLQPVPDPATKGWSIEDVMLLRARSVIAEARHVAHTSEIQAARLLAWMALLSKLRPLPPPGPARSA